MISLTSKRSHNSTTQPGAVIVIKKYSEGIRTEISVKMSALVRAEAAGAHEVQGAERSGPAVGAVVVDGHPAAALGPHRVQEGADDAGVGRRFVVLAGDAR